jgi:uncharacterized phage protein (TIGR01671 family)
MFDYNNKYLMEREILFRGKAINRDSGYYRTTYKNGDWVYGLLTQHYNKRYDLPAEMTNTLGVSGIEVDYETIGQYTGHTDKNGVKIFEGDIVKGTAYSATTIGVIVWIDEISSFGVRRVNAPNPTAWENSSILRCVSLGKTDEFAAEVIGNIHDNPELLGKE